MADAHKCDRCGKYFSGDTKIIVDERRYRDDDYWEYLYMVIDPRIETIEAGAYNAIGRVVSNRELDLCSECCTSFKEWWGEGSDG